jgi:surface protein
MIVTSSVHFSSRVASLQKTGAFKREIDINHMEEDAPRRLPNVVIMIIEGQSRQLPDNLLLPILSHLDVKTLIEKKRVCSTWRHACTEAIDAKQTSTTQKAFSTNQELRQAVIKYCGFSEVTKSYVQCDPQAIEEIAQTYGYPINKWDVSNLQDFSNIFIAVDTLNEDMSSWNVSNVTTMFGMFGFARSFNQDLSCWNVSNMTNMEKMFCFANAFNQDLSSWNVSNVTNMNCMFYDVTAFNQNLSNWNVSKVTNMGAMFMSASSFNQNLSLWNVSSVNRMSRMFEGATSFDQDIDSWDIWDSTKLYRKPLKNDKMGK